VGCGQQPADLLVFDDDDQRAVQPGHQRRALQDGGVTVDGRELDPVTHGRQEVGHPLVRQALDAQLLGIRLVHDPRQRRVLLHVIRDDDP
jgi:hypothetical protein